MIGLLKLNITDMSAWKEHEKFIVLVIFVVMYIVITLLQKIGIEVDGQTQGIILGIIVMGSKEWFDGKPGNGSLK